MSQAKKMENEVNSISLIDAGTETSKSQQIIDGAMIGVVQSLNVNYNIAAELEKEPVIKYRIINPDKSSEDIEYNTPLEAVGELLCFKDIADEMDRIRPELDDMSDDEWDEWLHDNCEEIAMELGYKIVAVNK